MDIQIVNNDSDNRASKVHITIECELIDAQWIMALSAPFASNSPIPLSYSALPEALVQLGKYLELAGEVLPYEYWSNLSGDLIDKFIEMMDIYQRAFYFNGNQWKKEFLNNLDSIQSKWGEETDKNLFDGIRSIVNLLSSRLAGPDQHQIYCDQLRTPVNFENWVDNLLMDPKITNEDISTAHLRAFDPIRLKELLKLWRENAQDRNDEEIPF